VIAPHLMKNLPYDPLKDFDYISIPFQAANVLVTGPAQPARTVAEVIALLKKNPGKITFASSGNGASDHLSAELLWQQTGTEGLHVPYKGGAPAMQDTLAGQIDFFMTNINAVLPHIRAGKLHPIAITDSARSPALPDVPTFAENGIPFEGDSWLAIMGPAGIPADVAAKLNQEIAATLRDPETQERLAKLGLIVVASPQGGLTEVLQRDVPKWGKAVKDSGAVAE